MLKQGHMHTALPVKDLDRARRFYSDKLGLEPAQDNPGGLLYRLEDGAEFLLYPSSYAPGGHTQAHVIISDLRGLVGALRERGVKFEDYDFPGLKTEDGIAADGPHLTAWFKDSEGNLIGLMQTGPTGD